MLFTLLITNIKHGYTLNIEKQDDGGFHPLSSNIFYNWAFNLT